MPINTQLKSYIDRIENLDEQKQVFVDDIKSVYKEAKTEGFDAKILRAVIKLRKLDPAERAEFESLIDTYMGALEGGVEDNG